MFPKRSMLAGAILLLTPLTAAFAQEEAVTEQEGGTRTINLMVYGNDACPEPETPDEIVVCGRLPEKDRYRIPKDLREKKQDDVPATAWTTQMEMLNQDMRYTRPDSCSVVGSYGQSGCFQQRIDQWRAERRAK